MHLLAITKAASRYHSCSPGKVYRYMPQKL